MRPKLLRKIIYLRIHLLLPKELRWKIYLKYLGWLWTINIRRYIKVIEAGSLPTHKLLERLIVAWGNPGYSGKVDYLEACIRNTKQANGLILECGSGLSTILMGVVAKYYGKRMISFEHLPEWRAKVVKELNRYNLNNNEVLLRSLVSYGGFDWYEFNESEDINNLALCICDGLPASTSGGRRGFLFLFKDKLKSGAVILVDDTLRKEEQRMIMEWKGMKSFREKTELENSYYSTLVIS